MIRLASRSPRRAELLTLVGAHFETVPVDIDEHAEPGERADAHVLRLAEAKARAAHACSGNSTGEEGVVYLGADTVVTLDRAILGKPTGSEDAARMLRCLSGRIHEVWTGLFILNHSDGKSVGGALRSIVRFAELDTEDIRRYVATGEPLDKAGAYAVQGLGALYVEAIEGSYSNVVGLPLSYLKLLLGLLHDAPVRPS